MPIYVYEVVLPDGSGGDRFELQQSMKEAALTEHPLTGEPVRRVILSPNLSTKHTPGKEKSRLDNKNVEKAGFTKYERDKLTGTYHRVAGKQGPQTFKPN
ncbi:MAG: FmdB family transcriptional regulator [Verrucomicrobiota bacterium JB022]|nr:FmdB family transcriptional regulator [Verrucomicrobiota bacterium JB022]